MQLHPGYQNSDYIANSPKNISLSFQTNDQLVSHRNFYRGHLHLMMFFCITLYNITQTSNVCSEICSQTTMTI